MLIRWVSSHDPQQAFAKRAVQELENIGAIACFTPQNLGEFWNALTRPLNRNGYGLTPHEAETRTQVIESRFRLLPDLPAIYEEWRRLLPAHSVRGVQVHDAHLAASMLVHSVPRVLTFNTADFKRFPGIEAIHPAQLATP